MRFEQRLRPGEPMKKWQCFHEKAVLKDGKEIIAGFEDPDGIYYPLVEAERLVHIQSADGNDRDTFIRKDGQDIPFEIWKQGK